MLAVKEIKQQGDRNLEIIWSDGVESMYDVVSLRRKCPCAACKENSDTKIDDTVRPVEIRSVGRYALLIVFSDGHRTGIYSFENLRKLQ